MTPAKRKILIVDDDADFAEAVGFFLESHGYAVLKARDGVAGLQLAKRERPDLIIMDIMMSERTEGLFTVQEIRHTPELKNVPVFVATALYSKVAEFQVRPESAWVGHDEFFSKPVDLPQLLEAIRRRLGQQPPAGPAREETSA